MSFSNLESLLGTTIQRELEIHHLLVAVEPVFQLRPTPHPQHRVHPPRCLGLVRACAHDPFSLLKLVVGHALGGESQGCEICVNAVLLRLGRRPSGSGVAAAGIFHVAQRHVVEDLKEPSCLDNGFCFGSCLRGADGIQERPQAAEVIAVESLDDVDEEGDEGNKGAEEDGPGHC